MDVLFAHLHFGQRGVNGGISVTFCDNTLDAEDTVPECPDSGTVEGIFEADDVVGPVEQGIEPGDIEQLISAMLAGATYADVHTTRFEAGELRGQATVLRLKCFPWPVPLDPRELRCIPPVTDADEETVTSTELR